MVAGRLVVKNRQLLTIEIGEVIDRVNDIAQDIRSSFKTGTS
jgi:hypothetical protein